MHARMGVDGEVLRADAPKVRDPAVCRSGRAGIALVTSILLLLLVAATAINAIDFSGQELQSGARGRAHTRVLYAADAGLQYALEQIKPPIDLTAIDITLDNIEVESRKRSEGSPQIIGRGGLGAPPEGYAVNIGAGYSNEVFEISITAVGVQEATVELEAKLGALQPNAGTF